MHADAREPSHDEPVVPIYVLESVNEKRRRDRRCLFFEKLKRVRFIVLRPVASLCIEAERELLQDERDILRIS